MCNNTSISSFLEGVNFMDDEQMTPMMDDEEAEILLMDDYGLLMLDNDDGKCEMETIMSDFIMDDADEGAPNSALPPLDMAHFVPAEDDDLVALMAEDGMPTPTPTGASYEQQAGLEKLAHALRQSEMALREQQRSLSATGVSTSNANVVPPSPSPKTSNPTEEQVMQKAALFFQGRRMTITPELEKSRQEVWAIIRAHQQQQRHWAATSVMTGAAA